MAITTLSDTIIVRIMDDPICTRFLTAREVLHSRCIPYRRPWCTSRRQLRGSATGHLRGSATGHLRGSATGHLRGSATYTLRSSGTPFTFVHRNVFLVRSEMRSLSNPAKARSDTKISLADAFSTSRAATLTSTPR